MNKREKKVVKQLLEQALEIIKDPKHWNQGTIARNHHNGAVSWNDPTASKFCTLGALRRSVEMSGTKDLDVYYDAKFHLENFIPKKHTSNIVTVFNDHKDTTHLMVKRLFQRAIKDLE